MSNTITVSARRGSTTKIMEFKHPTTNVWQDGQLLPNSTTDFFTQLTAVPNGTYGPGTLAYRLKGSVPAIGGTNTNTVTIDGGTSVITPNAPTAGVVDDTANTFDWTNTPGYTAVADYEYTLDGGTTYAALTAKPLAVGNVAKAAGQVGVRVKAATNRNASGLLASQAAFTVTQAPVVYDTTVSATQPTGSPGIADGMSVSAPTTEKIQMNLIAGTSGPTISIAITSLGATTYVDYASEYAGQGYYFYNSAGTKFSGAFPSADNLSITY